MVLYYWDKYNTNSTTSTVYSNSHLTASGSSSASISGYPNYTFSSSGGYQGYGSSYSPAVGDTVYGIISKTVMIEYYVKSKVGSTCTYDYWRYECDTSTGTVYSRGSYITTITAESYAYTDDARNSDGYWYVRGSQVPDNPPPTNPPSTPPNFRVTSKSKDSVNFAWDSVSGASSYSVEVWYGSTVVSQNYGLSGNTKFVSGLFSDTTYQGKLWAVNSGGNSSPTYVTFTTDPDIPPSSPTNFRITSQDLTSVNLAWDAVSGASSYSVETYIKDTSTLVNSNYGLTSTTKYINGLTSGTSYTFKLWAVNSNGNSTPVYTSATVGKPRPSNWSWSTLTPTATSYTSGILRANLVSATEWNNFCTRINAFRDYKNLSAYTFSSASSQSSFTSSKYSEAVNAISPMASVSQSGGFYTKLINLQSALNSI